MGQRTQIIVVKENKSGEKKVSVFHHQWGYGRNMYLALMDLFIQDYGKDIFAKDYNFLSSHNKPLCLDSIHNITSDIPNEELEKIDFSNISTFGNIFGKYCDNNNGGLVIRITEDKEAPYNTSSFSYGFMLGYEDVGEDEEPFSMFLSAREYGEKNGGSDYSDKEFISMFESFCKYFDIKFFGE